MATDQELQDQLSQEELKERARRAAQVALPDNVAPPGPPPVAPPKAPAAPPVANVQTALGMPPVVSNMPKSPMPNLPAPTPQIPVYAGPQGLPPVAPTTPPPQTPEEKAVADAQAKLKEKEGTKAGIINLQDKAKEVQNPVLRGLARTGAGVLRGIETVGDILAPGPMQAVPGTQLHHAAQIEGDKAELEAAEENRLKSEQAGAQKATAQQKNDETNQIVAARKAGYDLTKSPTTGEWTMTALPASQLGAKDQATINAEQEKIPVPEQLAKAYKDQAAAAPGSKEATDAAQRIKDLTSIITQQKTAGEKIISKDEADNFNKTWNPILQKANLPQNQFTPGMSESAANAVRTSIFGASSEVNKTAQEGKAQERKDREDRFNQGYDSQGKMLSFKEINPNWWVSHETGQPIPKASQPPAAERSSGETARVLLKNLPKVEALEKDIVRTGDWGRLQNQWEDFLNGTLKAGADPRFTELQTLLGLSTSGAMKAHFGTKGGQQMYPIFKNYFTPIRDQAGFDASLKGVKEYMQGYADEAYTKADYMKDNPIGGIRYLNGQKVKITGYDDETGALKGEYVK